MVRLNAGTKIKWQYPDGGLGQGAILGQNRKCVIVRVAKGHLKSIPFAWLEPPDEPEM